MKNTAADTVEQSLVFCGREDGKLVALRQMVRVGLAAAAVAHLRPVRRAGDAALPRARVRRAARGRAARGAHGRARPAAAADAASGGGAAPDDAEDVPS
jgi:ATP-dependent RNA helicase DDX52/ROK1